MAIIDLKVNSLFRNLQVNYDNPDQNDIICRKNRPPTTCRLKPTDLTIRRFRPDFLAHVIEVNSSEGITSCAVCLSSRHR